MHTPGPWHTFKGPGARIRIVGPTSEQIGESYNKDSDANAKLIAAAPALLEALEEMLKWAERADRCDVPWPAHLHDACVQAITAIKAAKGESS